QGDSLANVDPKVIEPGFGLLMGYGNGDPVGWSAVDLPDILAHQLRTPLLCDLKADPGQLLELLQLSKTNGGAPLNTFEDLLAHPKPPLWLLCLAKDFGKESD